MAEDSEPERPNPFGGEAPGWRRSLFETRPRSRAARAAGVASAAAVVAIGHLPGALGVLLVAAVLVLPERAISPRERARRRRVQETLLPRS